MKILKGITSPADEVCKGTLGVPEFAQIREGICLTFAYGLPIYILYGFQELSLK